MGNSYCEKDYSKVEAKVLEITQIRLQKMKKNVAMASFYCLVCKIWKKNPPGLWCLTSHNILMQVCNQIFIDIFLTILSFITIPRSI